MNIEPINWRLYVYDLGNSMYCNLLQFINICAIVVTTLKLKFDISIEVKSWQLWNILCIFFTFDVSNLDKSNDFNKIQL